MQEFFLAALFWLFSCSRPLRGFVSFRPLRPRFCHRYTAAPFPDRPGLRLPGAAGPRLRPLPAGCTRPVAPIPRAAPPPGEGKVFAVPPPGRIPAGRGSAALHPPRPGAGRSDAPAAPKACGGTPSIPANSTLCSGIRSASTWAEKSRMSSASRQSSARVRLTPSAAPSKRAQISSSPADR